MNNHTNLKRISEAIDFLVQHEDKQPKLEDLSRHLGLSSSYLHKTFSEYVGISPKSFLQSLTLESAKQHLLQSSTLNTSIETGLSSSSRLHDHFVTLEAVTPGEFKSRGEGMQFLWGIVECLFGKVFLCWTNKGIHQLFFVDSAAATELDNLKKVWPKAEFIQNSAQATQLIESVFSFLQKKSSQTPLSLWVKGTNFQVNVWRALLKIPPGSTVTYGQIANTVGNPKAQRAVGSAVGQNPISFIIPCHRVILKSGVIGNYRWGKVRKRMMLMVEEKEKTNG